MSAFRTCNWCKQKQRRASLIHQLSVNYISGPTRFAEPNPKRSISSMVSNCFSPRIFLSRLAIAATAFALVALPGAAQAQTASSSPGYSSSSDWQAALAKLDMPAAPSAKASAQYGQYGRRNNRRYPYYNSNWSHFAFEIGAGPTAPIGNASRDWETWGYNVNVGAGWNFSRYFGALIEYQFNRMKIPGHADRPRHRQRHSPTRRQHQYLVAHFRSHPLHAHVAALRNLPYRRRRLLPQGHKLYRACA